MRLRGGYSTLDPRLDRIPQFDSKSREFPIRELISREAQQRPRSYTWSVNAFLDQGSEGACVGFSWTHELIARPWVVTDHLGVKLNNAFAQLIYRRAQKLDEWAGEDYSGTSVLAGAKAVSELGLIREYRWAFGLDDLRLTLGYKGPAILGVNWYSGMFSPESDGRIRPIGHLAGGHAILAYSVNEKQRIVRLWNSWGQHWWSGGAWCYLTFDDLNRLLDEEGEACIPVVRRRR